MKQLLIFIITIGFFNQTALAFDTTWLTLDSHKVMQRAIPDLTNLQWQVGEYQERQIKSGFLKVGSLKSVVDREEGNAVWLINDLSIILQGDKKIEMLIDRTTGEILEYIEDGQKSTPPDVTKLNECEDLGEAIETVRVPAGRFKALRTILRCDDNTLAIWVNDQKVNMNGHVRQAVLTDEEDPKKYDYLVELVKFGKN